jgi:hypothetical protein
MMLRSIDSLPCFFPSCRSSCGAASCILVRCKIV